jgi:hypothetical protein
MLERWFITHTTVAVGSMRSRPGRVHVADAHPVQQPRHAASDPVTGPEVQVGVEGRDDLARVGFDKLQNPGIGWRCRRENCSAASCTLGSVSTRWIKGLPPRALERADADAQPGRHLVDHLVRGLRHHPA